MSVNLHLSIIIRDYNPSRRDIIKQAIQEELVKQQLNDDLPPLTESIDEKGCFLATYSNRDAPVIISNAYKWIPQFRETLQQKANLANQGNCNVHFDGEDADDEDYQDYEEEDESEENDK